MEQKLNKEVEKLEELINTNSNSEEIFNKSKQIDELIIEFQNKKLKKTNESEKL